MFSSICSIVRGELVHPNEELNAGRTAIDGLSGLGDGAEITDSIDPHWPGDVLDLLLAQILEHEGQPVAYVVMDGVGDEHPAGIGQGFDPRGDVDAVAINIIGLDDHSASPGFTTMLRFNRRTSASIPQPKPLATYAAGEKKGRKAGAPALDTPSKNGSSRVIRPFIPPPTREQLMAGSANLRRVYKVEG
jgi:hypothetical protein